jgi:Protein of unknown function (DUF2752)
MTTQEQVATRQRLRGPLALGATVLAGFAVVGLVDPHDPGHYPVCPTRSVLGIYCPLCGGLRAANDLTHGDVLGAASSNLLFALVLPVAFVAWLLWVRDRARGSTRDLWTPTTRQLWVAAAVLVIFMVVRNLPFGSALAP